MTQIELDKDKKKKYKIEVIYDSEVYIRESEDYLLGFYSLVSWKSYTKKRNIWEPALAI